MYPCPTFQCLYWRASRNNQTFRISWSFLVFFTVSTLNDVTIFWVGERGGCSRVSIIERTLNTIGKGKQ
uniref:Uncharacterized protein n=1 Tax=Rhizophora mucronata TaxID=61149 RepID=A0A2P2NKR6_RHIMU